MANTWPKEESRFLDFLVYETLESVDICFDFPQRAVSSFKACENIQRTREKSNAAKNGFLQFFHYSHIEKQNDTQNIILYFRSTYETDSFIMWSEQNEQFSTDEKKRHKKQWDVSSVYFFRKFRIKKNSHPTVVSGKCWRFNVLVYF